MSITKDGRGLSKGIILALHTGWMAPEALSLSLYFQNILFQIDRSLAVEYTQIFL